ncbi:MoaD/ThiS family protein [Tessaracoccus palaemonis]|uniref:MoaD/ThiS family protein n=1 Tax=Tessaracoccus palaemonis TaxID=2829499 RepID=A0ABX8SIP3_9ACTN|nr:MoaD/ThiS family protein [Tessaracoccus palaemonis]QXT62295.1 MoaD/ThiS family protein [Tessaracoccus palaemonis]
MEVRFFAGAAEAAGVESLQLDGEPATRADLVAHLARDNERLARVLEVSALLADGVRLTQPASSLAGVQRVDVLPPFAGG